VGRRARKGKMEAMENYDYRRPQGPGLRPWALRPAECI
jgi:hypothetical protein